MRISSVQDKRNVLVMKAIGNEIYRLLLKAFANFCKGDYKTHVDVHR